MNTFRRNSQYIAGNSDPFTPSENSETSADDKNTSATNNEKETEQRITNSNDGKKNPASTGK